MAELVDWDLLLEKAPQEYARALLSAQAEPKRLAAHRAREVSMVGNPAARLNLARSWSPLTKHPAQSQLPPAVQVYEGEGPPPEPVPAGVPAGVWYLDTLTDTIYRLEA